MKRLRQRFITGPLFNIFKKVLPPISATEREAINAGDVFWEGELFKGKPNWDALLKLPTSTLSQEEMHFLDNQVERLCEMLNDWEITHHHLDLPQAVWQYLKEEKFFGMIIPKEYGGLGFSALAHSTIIQKIATRSLTAAVTAMVPNSLGPAELLLAYGTQTQKQYYLPRLSVGIEIPCFALTGPEAGSDAGAIPDLGVVTKGMFDGKEIIGMRLTFNKRYITLAPVATVIALAFKLSDPEGLLGGKKELGITLCLLPAKHPGVEIGKRHFPLNQPFMNGPIRGKEIFVPLDWMVGGVKMAGHGWHMIVECLSAGRGISLPAVSTAAGKACYRTTGAYAHIRKQFHTSIGSFEGVEEVLARIAGYTYLLEATRLFTVSAIDHHHRPSVASSISKYHMSELFRKVMNDSMDVHGGKGIMLGPRNYLGRGFESIPIGITVEGANIMMRTLMIFGQGAIRCHPYVAAEMAALVKTDPTQGIEDFDKAISGHILYSLRNLGRLIFASITGGYFCAVPRAAILKPLRPYIRQLGRMSIAFSVTADIAMLVFGGKLKRRERLSARLGDILSYLYLGSATLKYAYDAGDKKHDIPHASWALQFCLYNIQRAFYGFFKNFRHPVIARCLSLLIFPFGRPYHEPSDELEHTLAACMMTVSEFRDRLTQYCYLGAAPDAVSTLEEALHCLMVAEPMFEKIYAAEKIGLIPKHLSLDKQLETAFAEKILNSEERDAILKFEGLKNKVIQVDEFTENELKR